MGSCEIFRKFKKVETRLEDINPPVPLSQFAEDSRFELKDEISDALEFAISEFKNEGISPDEVLGYYYADAKGVVTKLEVRHVPTGVAYKINDQLVFANLGGYIAKTFGKNEATVGLPHPVNVFKRVEVEKGK